MHRTQIIVAAGYTDVDKAEGDEKTAHAVNATGPGAIARAAAELSVPIVYLSSDYVFDGAKEGPYEEDDPVGPLSAYGRSKVAGEAEVRTANPRHLILRTSWVYGASGSNFLSLMLERARKGGEVRVASDQYGSPTAAPDLAAAIAKVLPALVAADGRFGTFHLAGSEGASRHAFAEAIFSGLEERGLRRPKNVPVALSSFPLPAPRPANSRLSSERFTRTFGLRLPGYRAALPAILDKALALSSEPAVSEAS